MGPAVLHGVQAGSTSSHKFAVHRWTKKQKSSLAAKASVAV
jgi:hypothetical protein